MAAPLDGFKLEVAFASGPFDPAPTWTDITAYWRMDVAAGIEHGRLSEFGEVGTGTLALTLDNTDGRFTVGNTSSPYYPNVKLRKQIRVTYTQSAVVYPRFKGHVEVWPLEWPAGGDTYAWAQIRASDRFKSLGTPRALRSVPDEETLVDNPQVYYPLGESDGATAAGNTSPRSVGSNTAAVTQLGTGGTVAFAAATGVPTDGLSAPTFTRASQTSGKILRATGTFGSTTALAFECAFITSLTASNQRLISLRTVSGLVIALEIDTTEQFRVSAYGDNPALDTGPGEALTGSGPVTNTVTHVVLVSITPNVAGAVVNAWLDGAQIITAGAFTSENALLSATLPTFSVLEIGGGAGNAIGAATVLFNGSMSHVSVYDTAVTGTRPAAHYNAMMNGFVGDSTGARLTRVADWCGVASGDRSIATGKTTSIRHVDTTGKTAQSFMQELADTEGGLVFMDTAGKLQFQDRQTRINTTAALTLAATSQQVSPDVAYRSNDQFLLNDVTYSRVGGVTYRAVDATSVADYGTIAAVAETYTTSDNEVLDHANWVVYTSKTPTARIEQLGVDLLTDTASRVAALLLEISSKVSVTGMPTSAPAATASVFVEGWTETISFSEWSLKVNTSPADLYSPLWKLGTAGFSELGQTTTLSF